MLQHPAPAMVPCSTSLTQSVFGSELDSQPTNFVLRSPVPSQGNGSGENSVTVVTNEVVLSIGIDWGCGDLVFKYRGHTIRNRSGRKIVAIDKVRGQAKFRCRDVDVLKSLSARNIESIEGNRKFLALSVMALNWAAVAACAYSIHETIPAPTSTGDFL